MLAPPMHTQKVYFQQYETFIVYYYSTFYLLVTLLKYFGAACGNQEDWMAETPRT